MIAGEGIETGMIHLNWRGCETKILKPTASEVFSLVLILAALVVVLVAVANPKALELLHWIYEHLPQS
jgi:hypothetical protein